MKILKHIFRVLSAHTGPFQGLNMITTDCQNCINNFHFHFLDTIVYKKIYKSMAASLSLVTLVPLANGTFLGFLNDSIRSDWILLI